MFGGALVLPECLVVSWFTPDVWWGSSSTLNILDGRPGSYLKMFGGACSNPNVWWSSDSHLQISGRFLVLT